MNKTNFSDFIKAILDPNDGRAEVKLLVGLAAFAYVLLAGVIDLFTKYHPSDFIFYGILGLVLGIFGIEAFSMQKGSTAVSSHTSTTKIEVETKEVNKEPEPTLIKD